MRNKNGISATLLINPARAKLIKFNKINFDKKLSPAEKWALVEGLACHVP